MTAQEEVQSPTARVPYDVRHDTSVQPPPPVLRLDLAQGVVYLEADVGPAWTGGRSVGGGDRVDEGGGGGGGHLEFDFEEVEGVHAKHGDRASAYACKSVVLWRECGLGKKKKKDEGRTRRRRDVR